MIEQFLNDISDELVDPNDVSILKKALLKVTTFHFTRFHPLTDKIHFSKITSVLGNQLERLCLSEYLEDTPYDLNFQSVIDLIKKNKFTLKHIHLYSRNINDKIIQSISCIEGLNLRSFNLGICENVTDSGLQKLFESQKNIICLNLNDCSRITNRSVAMICQYLPRITSLKMSGCSSITKVSIFSFLIYFVVQCKKFACFALKLIWCENIDINYYFRNF